MVLRHADDLPTHGSQRPALPLETRTRIDVRASNAGIGRQRWLSRLARWSGAPATNVRERAE